MEFITALGDRFSVPEVWWREAGALEFRRVSQSFPAGPPEREGLPDPVMLAVADIRPPRRAPGVTGLVRERAVAILTAFAHGAALPPVVVYAVPDAPFLYRLGEGFHRFHLSLAAGFTHVPASVLTYWEPWMTGDPAD